MLKKLKLLRPTLPVSSFPPLLSSRLPPTSSSHTPSSQEPPQRVLVLGGTGFLGGAVAQGLLHEGHHVTVVSRKPESAARSLVCSSWRLSDDAQGRLEVMDAQFQCHRSADAASKGFDVVVNLAGTPIMEPPQRWGEAQVKEIFDSRVKTAERLGKYLSGMHRDARRPKTLLAGSAIGWYGVPTEEQQEAGAGLTERTESPSEGSSLSQRLCQAWEAASLEAGRSASQAGTDNGEQPADKPAEERKQRQPSGADSKSRGCRVVLLRTGVVLDGEYGALQQMLPPFSLGLGGCMGSGRQWLSWIHLHDWLQVVGLALRDTSVEGPLNATAPAPVRNEELTRTLAAALHRPAFFHLPAAAVRAVFGAEPANEMLLHGHKILPQKALEHGLEFRYADVQSALKEICGR